MFDGSDYRPSPPPPASRRAACLLLAMVVSVVLWAAIAAGLVEVWMLLD